MIGTVQFGRFPRLNRENRVLPDQRRADTNSNLVKSPPTNVFGDGKV